MDVINVDENINSTATTNRTKKKPLILGKGSSSDNLSTSKDLQNTSTTQIGHDVDPEKRKSPSKRRSIVKPKRKPQAQGYYRRRLEYFDTKQNGTKEEVAKFNDFSAQGIDMIPAVMDGQTHPQHLFPLYHKAINSYLDAALKLRQTILTERKLAAEVWGDNSIASFTNGIYIVQKNLIEDLLRPKSEEINVKPGSSRKAAPKKRKESIQEEVPKEPVIDYDPDNYDINDFIEFSDNMAITRSQTKAIRQQVEPSPPPPVPVTSALSSKGKRKNVNSNVKDCIVKKTRFSKDSSSNTPTPPPISIPPSAPAKKIPPKAIKETPMPHFKIIEENKISRNAQEIIKDTKVLQCYCKPDVGCDDTCVNRILHMECGSRCKVGDQCQNKRFQKLQYAAFEPFFAGVKGWGIRAVKPIHRGDFIVEYVGEVVDSWEMAKRQKRYTKNNHKHHYMMSLRNGAVIDATACGNFSRFVNHSCDPNAETQKWVVSREIRIGFFAKKDIAAGEEIVFDYAFERFGKEAQECYCGSENCTGFIGSKPDEGDNDEEEAGSSGSTSEETDDEATKDAANVVKKVAKPKLTQEEKDFRKRMAKARRKLVKARREFRKVVGRKKNFSEEEILEFNRQMYRINDYDQRFLLINFMLSVPDDQWKRTFMEKNGIEVIWSWLTDYTGNVSLKTFVRLQNGLIKFLDSLPIDHNDHLKLMIAVIKDIMNVQLPDDIILQETLNELVDVVADEPEIPDKDLARMLDRDKVSMIKLYDETVEICKRLYEVWSTLPSLLTDGCVDVSGDEMDESKAVEMQNNDPIILDDELPSYETAMETDFDTPEQQLEKSEIEIVTDITDIDIGARKHFRSSSRSEKENSREKKFRSRSRSRSFSPRGRQRSCSKSPIGFGNYLQIAVKTDYRDSDRRYSDRFDHHRNRDRRPRYDDYYRGKHFKDRRPDRYYDDRYYENRRYEDRDRRNERYRDDRHHRDSRYRNHRHYDHHSDRRDRHSHSHRRNSNSPQRVRRHHSQSPERTKKSSQSPERTKKHSTKKQSPLREHRSVFAKEIKIEIPDTSPIIKSESPPEILSKNASPLTSSVSITAPPSSNTNVTASKSNNREISFESVFPDAPKLLRPSSNEIFTSFSIPPPDLPGTGPKFRSTMQFQGYANTRPTRPPPIRFGGFQRPVFHQRIIPPVRLPIVVPPPPPVPQFVALMPPQPWYGYPYCAVPPPPPNFHQHIQIEPPLPVPAPQLLEIDLPPEPAVPDPQPSYELFEKSINQTHASFGSSVKEIKKEEISPVVSDPVQSQPTPEEEEEVAQEAEKSKLKPYEKNPDWIETYTDDGIIYYYHKETRETSWEEPPPKAPEKPKAAPAFHHSNVSNRSESSVEQSHNLNDVELKKQFKLKIWQNIHKYLKPRKEIQGIDDGTLTQFARKMTHKCLEAETRNGNKNLEITEKVYLRARQITDQNYAQFLTEVQKTIKTEPLH